MVLGRFGRAGISQVKWKSSAEGMQCSGWFLSSTHTLPEGRCRLDPASAGAGDGARPPWGTHEAALVCAHWDGTSLGCAQSGWDQGGCWLRVLGPHTAGVQLSHCISQMLGVSGEGSLRHRRMQPGGREASATNLPQHCRSRGF